jgi:F5/8 type C domain
VTGETVSCACGSPPTTGQVLKIVGSGRTASSLSSTYAYDNDKTTDWHTTASTPPRSTYAYFDLGSAKAIRTIKWMFARTGSADSFKIQVSTDKATWKTIATKGNAASANAWQSLSWTGSTWYVRFSFANPIKDGRLGYLSEIQILS